MQTTARRILLIEDDGDNAEASQVLFEYWGYEVDVATDRAGALGRVTVKRPDVIVLDLGLPQFEEGCALVREIRAIPGTPILIVAVTGYGRESDRRRALEAGCDFFFAKPADLDALHDVMSMTDVRCRRVAKLH